MKLYWRVKLNGKWTWRPATVVDKTMFGNLVVRQTSYQEEEE